MKLKTVGLILLVAGIVGASIGVVFSVFSTGYLTVEVRWGWARDGKIFDFEQENF